MIHDNKCVCEICTCGHHHCPPHMRAQPTGTSVFKNDYVPFKIQKEPSFNKQPQYKQRGYNPNDLKSIYNQDFDKKKPQLERVNRVQQPAIIQLPFAKGSEYNNSYVPHQYDGRQRPVEKQQPMPSMPFNQNTTYNNDFKNFDNKPDRSHKQKQQQQYPPGYSFNGNTTYKDNFNKHPFDPVKPTLSIHGKPSTTNNPFDGSTIYNNSYKKYPGAYDKHICPVEELPQRPRNCSPGKNHVTYQSAQKSWV
ncbi:hypothetical protein PPERSA_09309 [Pseudocohnilembus persalinus]|uniref:STOP protein n=1 Tax=Pseudocohnilembus persalinus TaxID=266149 RepID=A0A0V0R596_PSEPJ|nr:hypothetical protein PPERSA_09309 [Pseudocohnilembus persalinus]|eukprot:KRX09639.1 hypothetical protein PPERSA_09309 [Pseudocohnilembus persalinus]